MAESASLIGQTVSHYRIIEKLGGGGMGVVYKAEDTHLDRFVAVKLLPAETVADPVRKRRFIQEAKSASALNHPNIITIHDIDQQDGLHFIAMEYVAGKPLDQHIGRKGLKLNETLKCAIQVADALAAAHAAGIVHRDLKPANIMVAEKGLVKVLDFGLAKLTEADPGYEGETLSRKEEPRTEEGTILGTAAYMSPEQAEGKKVDARSDIFSFGSVLYEMITGRRAFRGETRVSTLSAILKEEPQPISTIAEYVPHELERIVARCLRKDPARRFQTTADLRIALEELKEESESGKMVERVAASPDTRSWLWALSAVGAVLLAAAAWFMRSYVSPSPQQTLVPVTTYPGSELFPSFSPDGKQIAFFWDGENGSKPGIYVKLLGETNALRLTTGTDQNPAWAPDGKRIAFRRGDRNQGIYTVSALGGAERKLTGLVPNSQISWSPDGNWLSLSLNDDIERGIVLLRVEGGELRRISSPQPPAFDQSPAFDQDGHRLAYASCAGEYSCDVYVQDLDARYSPRGLPRPITRQRASITGVTWSRDGGSLIYAASQLAGMLPYLWQARADGRQAPQRLEIAGPLAYSPSASPTANRLIFSRRLRDYDIWRYRTGDGIEPLIMSSLADYNPQFSPDGTRIAFESSRSGEAEEIWVAQADGSQPVQITNRLGRHQGTPRWSPDSRWIAFDSQGQDGHWDIYVIEAAGGSPRRITFEPSDENQPFWSHDGNWIYFRSNRTGRTEIWRVPFAGGRQEQVTTQGGSTAYESVDGTSLFYTKADSGPLFVRRLSGGEERQVLPYVYLKSFAPVTDGIYYLGPRSDEGSYPLEFFQFSSGVIRLLTKIPGSVFQGLSVSPDRKTILFTKSVSVGADLMMIESFR
jgi:serine/threonine protein kinase